MGGFGCVILHSCDLQQLQESGIEIDEEEEEDEEGNASSDMQRCADVLQVLQTLA